jgi:WD40 repeat protein
MGKEIRVFDGHRGWVTSLAFSPDSRLLLSTSTDGVAIVWRVSAKGN